MKETKYLSDKVIDLKNIAGPYQNKDEVLPLDKKFPEVQLRSKFDAAHYSLFMGNKQLPLDKSASAEVREIVEGLFKGCYVVVERDGIIEGRTRVFMMHKDGFLQIANVKELLADQAVEKMLTKEYIARLTAKRLNTFDLGQDRQAYRFFFEKLPKFLFTDEKIGFVESVEEYFSSNEIELIPNQNNRFVKTELCKEEAAKFFNGFVQAYKDEKEIG